MFFALRGSRIVSMLFFWISIQSSFDLGPFTVNAYLDEPEPASSSSQVRRVAIIGAGAAGASTSYHLHKFAAKSGLDIDVVVFEKSHVAGGRSTTVNAFGNPLEPVELGASIFVEVNTILKNASDAFGLKPKNSTETGDDETLGIWDGENFVFTQKSGGWYYWDIAKMLWKYGFAPLRTRNLMRATVGKFLKLYEAPFFPFRSLTERAIDLDLISATSATGRQYLQANNIGEPFSTDIIQASTRVNYAQNLVHIHGLETMVCMAIEGAMQINGGNWQIFDRMLNVSGAAVLFNTSVSSISKQKGKYSIQAAGKSKDGKSEVKEELFDTVVLAAPLQFTNIEVEKDLLRFKPDEIPYTTLHVTLFSSPNKLNPKFFNLKESEEAPDTVLTTLPPNPALNHTDESGLPGFFSISTLRSTTNPSTGAKEYLYKIFSPKVVTSDFLSDILGAPIPADLGTIKPDGGEAITWYYPHVWKSYPVGHPRVTFEEIELARGFYYTSGIESFISTMETSALMGMNVAQLIVNDYLELFGGEMEKIASQQAVLEEKVRGSEEL